MAVVNGRNWQDVLVFAALVALGVATRLIPYYSMWQTWNVTATAAAALFAGFYFANWRVALAVPLLIMAIADVRIGVYAWSEMAVNYTSMAIAVILGVAIKRRPNPWAIGGAALASSMSFYLLSNFIVWVHDYAHTWAGFAHCYLNAIPFFWRSMVGDVAFAAIFFAAYLLAARKGWIYESQPQGELVATA